MKKSFFYNPQFRFAVYNITGVFMLTFKALVLIMPNWEQKIDDYELGDNQAALFIGFVSGFVFNLIYIVFTFSKRVWDFEMVFYSILFYILTGLMGFLSLIKFRDYQEEIRKQR